MSGMKPKFAIDSDKHAIDIYSYNVDKNAIVGKVENLHLPEDYVDVLVGGLPCQGFSTLGKRNPYDSRNYIWKHFIRLLKETRAEFFLVENVPEFLKSFHFKQFLREVQKLNYKVNYAVVNALDYGVAQNRRRVLAFGSKKRVLKIPEPVKDGDKTMRDAIGDLPFVPDGKNDHCSRNFTKLSLERYKHIPPGGNRFNLPYELQSPCWRRTKKGASNVFGRLKWDKPSGTIRTTFIQPECGRYIHPEADRPLTIREGARLQGFPDYFDFVKPQLRVKSRAIGNAVPVSLAKACGESILSTS